MAKAMTLTLTALAVLLAAGTAEAKELSSSAPAARPAAARPGIRRSSGN
jgi:hypothetical protein